MTAGSTSTKPPSLYVPNTFQKGDISLMVHKQCDPVQVYWDDTATKPVTVLGVIPSGQLFEVVANDGANSRGMSTLPT